MAGVEAGGVATASPPTLPRERVGSDAANAMGQGENNLIKLKFLEDVSSAGCGVYLPVQKGTVLRSVLRCLVS